MSRVRVVLSRLRALAGADRRDRELEDEIDSHLAEAADEFVRQGLAPDEARRAAGRRFGNLTRTREVYRETASVTWPGDLARDVRHGLHMLRRAPAYTAAAATTLALAIGASTAMLSVLDTVLLRPLPYHAPESLAMLWTENPAQRVREGRSALVDVDEWRRQSRSFADFATFDIVGTTMTGAEGTERLRGVSISPNLLSVLGVQPILGRSFSLEDAVQRRALVLVSHRFWQTRLGGAREALGATLVVDGQPSQVVGVMPPDFRVGRIGADVWKAHASPGQGVRGPETWFVIGRLRPGVSVEQAQAEMSAIVSRLSDGRPEAERRRGVSVVPLALQLVGRESRLALWMLAGAVGVVFLIAAANVTSLTVARGAARAREMAVRAALGASAGRLARQLLTESALLAAVSGALGVALAAGAIRLIRAFGPGSLPGLAAITLDARVLGWALAISCAAGILVGLASATMTVGRELRPTADDGGRSVSAGASASRLRRALVVAEFALALVLLFGAGLLVRSWLHVIAVDPGFRPEGVLVMDLASPPAVDDPAQRSALYQRVLEEIQALPGVEAAGITGDFFIDNSREQVLTVDGDAGLVSERMRIDSDEVSPGFFTTLGTPLLRGRVFSIADGPDAPPVAIVNEAMARRAWPGQDPVGRRFRLGAADAPWHTVVGVVGDLRRQGLERESFPQAFVPLAQSGSGSVDVFVRPSTDETAALAGALRAAVARVDRRAPVAAVVPLEQQLGAYLTQRRFQTSLLAGFAAVALLMAAVGIYGLIQYSIAVRTREIGLRMAVGAQAGDIFRMMIREGLTLSVSGLAIGLLGAWWFGRAVSGLLVGVAARDTLTFATASMLLTTVALAACYFPARRAAGVDPTVALRAT
jgi:putative ABC transport system permease protein